MHDRTRSQATDALLDAAYQRMRGTGPEFEGWLSNHGPMAVDALIRIGRPNAVDSWVAGYLWKLEDAPRPRWRIEESEWREVIGDPSRLGDWLAFFDDRVHAIAAANIAASLIGA